MTLFGPSGHLLRCRTFCGYFRGLLKALFVLALCGTTFFLCFQPPLDVEPEVVTLTDDNFDFLVTSSEDPWLVEFFAPWCPHCKKFADEYTRIGERLKGEVNVGNVNVDTETMLKKRFQVKSFPTLMIFLENKTSPVTYRGARTEEAVVSTLLADLGVTR